MRFLLDANAVLKRYVSEPGSVIVTEVFGAADSGQASLVYSLWTLGECLGVLDRLDREGRLPARGLAEASRALLGETTRLTRLDVLIVVPLGVKLIRRAWDLLLKHHLYQADAIQVASALERRVDILLTTDAQVALAARGEGLRVLDPEQDEAEIAKALRLRSGSHPRRAVHGRRTRD
ncbi:MAG: type II toxin-antitoxin system VapC family toxin [Methanobacteriota archaeon]|nr:MAG: type II toxin-antitoxin system VapC family toxin [Euryarchaeota archaeon]